MESEFPTRPLGELVENHNRLRVPIKESLRKPGKYPYYGAQGIVDYVESFIFDGEYVLVAEDGENLRSQSTPVALLARGKFWVNNHAHIVRATSEANNRYLVAAINLSDIGSYVSGSAIPKLTKAALHAVPIPCPDKPEQDRIAAIIQSIDDRLDHNRALATNLEAIARRLFKSWFVDFDPVRAKAAGEKPLVLADDIAALFPDRFMESELGEIPEGWGFKSLSSFAEFVNGRNFTKEATGTGKMVIRIAELSNDGPSGSTVWNDLPDTAEQYLAEPGDILFAWSGSLGMHVWDRDAGLVNQHIFKVIPKPPFNKPFVFFAIEELIDDFRTIAASKAVTMGHIKRGDLDTHGLSCPSDQKLTVAFQKIVAPLWNRVRVARRETLALSAIRDLLLPRLISGKLRVTDAKTLIEEAIA